MADKLNFEKAVDDAIRNLDSDDKRTIEGSGTFSSEAIGAGVTAELGKGWTLGGMFKRFRRTKVNEGAIKFTKEF